MPWATSSLCAAEADFTRALVAAAMDLAASKICSSKSRVSSACYNEKRAKSYDVQPQGTLSQATYCLITWLFQHLLLFVDKPHPGLGGLSFCGLPSPSTKK